MADILNLNRSWETNRPSGSRKAGRETEPTADIIIFPGVRYDRSDDGKKMMASKPPAGEKSTA